MAYGDRPDLGNQPRCRACGAEGFDPGLKCTSSPYCMTRADEWLRWLLGMKPANCKVCRGTGLVDVPEQDGEGMYQTACPEAVHNQVTDG